MKKDKYPNTKQKNWHHKNKKATAIYQNFTNGTPYYTDYFFFGWHASSRVPVAMVKIFF